MGKSVYFVILNLIIIFGLSQLRVNAQNNEQSIIDNFEDNNFQSSLAGPWIPVTDNGEGGNSKVKIDISKNGYRSAKSLCVRYKLGNSYIHKHTRERKQPFAFVGLLANKQYLQHRDLSGFKGITLQVRGEGDFVCIIVCEMHGQLKFYLQEFHAQHEKWTFAKLLFAKFKPILETKQKLNSEKIVMFGLGKPYKLGQKNKGKFYIDDVTLIKKAHKKRVQQKTVRFGSLLINVPSTKWQWQRQWQHSELVYKNKVTGIYFIAIPMFHHSKIPFSHGLMADPGNIKQLTTGIRYELEKLGFRDIKHKGYKKIRLKNLKSRRILFFAEHPALDDYLDKVGIRNTRACILVDFIRYRSTAYIIVSATPQAIQKKMLKIIKKILYYLRTR